MDTLLAIWNSVPEGIQTSLVIIIKIVAIVVPIMLSVAYLTLAERKVIGYIQVRIGPNRVGPRGLLQPIADGCEPGRVFENVAVTRPLRRAAGLDRFAFR